MSGRAERSVWVEASHERHDPRLICVLLKRLLLLPAILLFLASCRPESVDPGRVDAGSLRPGQLQPSREEPQPSREGLQRILSGQVHYLASDALGGREVGTSGIAEAERYIANTFRFLGLTPLPGREDYLLEFTLYRGGYDVDATSLVIRAGGTVLEARPGVDFRPFDFSATTALEGDVVFAGYGITAPEYRYDDYEGLDTRGKIVFLLRHEPQSPAGSEYFQGADLTRHSLFRTKAENAMAHGASGMLLVTDPNSSAGTEDFRFHGPLVREIGDLNRSSGKRLPLPAVHISQPFAEKILGASKLDLARLQDSLDRGSSPADLQFDHMIAALNVAMEQTVEEVRARNVCAFLSGSDAVLRDQWILIGAHHDHLGSFPGRGDTVFNGADDNASGTAGVLALARILSALNPPPARSIIFTTFSAEEEGLLGSREMVASQIPTDNLVLMINLDMIGRNPGKPLQVITSSPAADLQHLVEKADREGQLSLRFSTGPETAISDYEPFNRLGIPFLFFFTGLHEDYHSTGDEAQLLSYPRLADVVQLVAATVELAAQMRPFPESTE